MLMKDIEKINSGMKESQVSSPIMDSFNNIFFTLLAEAITAGVISKLDVFWLW
jgi:hypothetical protein